MKRTFIFVILAVFSGCSSAEIDDGSPLTEIPKKFHGVYDSSEAGCSSRYSDGRVSIFRDSIVFYESSGAVTGDVVRDGANRIQVGLMMEGEGETWMDYRYYELSEDGEKLHIEAADYQFEVVRCN